LQPPVRSEPNAGRLQAAPTHDFVGQALDAYFFESPLVLWATKQGAVVLVGAVCNRTTLARPCAVTNRTYEFTKLNRNNL